MAVLNVVRTAGFVRTAGEARRKPNVGDYINLGGTHEHILVAGEAADAELLTEFSQPFVETPQPTEETETEGEQ